MIKQSLWTGIGEKAEEKRKAEEIKRQ